MPDLPNRPDNPTPSAPPAATTPASPSSSIAGSGHGATPTYSHFQEQSGSLGSTSGAMQRMRPWLPLMAFAVLIAVGFGVQMAVHDMLRAANAQHVSAMRDAMSTVITRMMKSREESVAFLATDDVVRDLALELHHIEIEAMENDLGLRERLLAADQLQQLVDHLQPHVKLFWFEGASVVCPMRKCIASTHGDLIGGSPSRLAAFAGLVLEGDGQLVVSPPERLRDPLSADPATHDMHTILVGAPILDDEGEPRLALVLHFHPEIEFSKQFELARLGETGESYAVSANGEMISRSRFRDELQEIGLAPDRLVVRNPGADLTVGEEASGSPHGWPYTVAMAGLKEGGAGVNTDGYANYLGRRVVGSWTWLDAYNVGVVSEIAYDEAYAVMWIPRKFLYVLFALLGLFLVGSAIGGIYACKQRERYRKAIREAKQLGQYTLNQKLGEGGMGAVYRATHAMLRRPTAVKLLRPDKAGGDALVRFEREVQMTSQLTHPNTIAIYDFGRTPDGIFYYAMEYLPGVTLRDLVAEEGAQPASRVIHVLTQACGSLSEAHHINLIHRDIKPANLMLCERGGEYDVVKVLDFGLVKDPKNEDMNLTAPDRLMGTPLYMAPEQILKPEIVDGRADQWSLAAVGYFLLAGKPIHDATSIMDVIAWHMAHEQPEPIATRGGVEVPADLEAVLMRALHRDPEHRYGSIGEFAAALRACTASGKWCNDTAGAEWKRMCELFPQCRHTGGTAFRPSKAHAAHLNVDLHDRVADDDKRAPEGDADSEVTRSGTHASPSEENRRSDETVTVT